MRTFWLCFVPLFVAVDSIGVMPLFIGFIHNCDNKQVRRIIVQSMLTALAVALAFLFVGEAVLRLLGITVEDFLVAGGIVLFLISIADLLTKGKPLQTYDPGSLGPVPLGVPLIVGPAVLTTIMLLVREYGFFWTGMAVTANILIAGVMFTFAGIIMRVLGDSGAAIASKIANLLLASIAVMMVRKGVFALITAFE